MELVIKIVAVGLLLAIMASLGSGLFFLVRDRSRSRRTLNALTLRITLSVLLFVVVVVGMLTGVLTPNTIPLH